MALALTSFHVAIIFIGAALFIAAAITDAYSYRIPNYLCFSLLVLFPILVMTAPQSINWRQNAAVFAMVTICGIAMFLGKVTAAGDVKLLSVASLWAGPHLIAILLVVTALAGGLLSAFMMGLIMWRYRGAKRGPQWSRVPIPYGIAIATGSLAMLGAMARPILLPG